MSDRRNAGATGTIGEALKDGGGESLNKPSRSREVSPRAVSPVGGRGGVVSPKEKGGAALGRSGGKAKRVHKSKPTIAIAGRVGRQEKKDLFGLAKKLKTSPSILIRRAIRAFLAGSGYKTYQQKQII